MGVVVRRYIDILTIIINFPYSTCISFFGSSIPTSLFIFKMFFRSCFCYFLTIYSKRYSKSIRDHSNKSRSREYNYLIISIIKNVERASTARVRVPRFPCARYPCLMVKLRFRLGRVTEKPLARCTLQNCHPYFSTVWMT